MIFQQFPKKNYSEETTTSSVGIRSASGQKGNILSNFCSTGEFSLDLNITTANIFLKLIHDKWLNMNIEITYTKILKTTNRTHIENVGKYLDIVKNKWFSTIKEL